MAWICDKNGNHRCEIKQLSYNGTFMEVPSITITVESPALIAFAIGDYIDWDYDGLRYTLDTAAGVEKQARRNSVGNAFLYENLVFLSPLQAAQNADFFDVILGNTNDFLTNTEFSFYGTAWDYAKRLEANLCRLYGSGTWKVRIWTNGTCYDATPAAGIDTGAWENKLVDVSGIKCLGGFQQIYDLWGCAYVFSVVSGVNYVDFYDDFEQYAKAWQAGGVDKIFAYGKGNGLYKIRHTPDADHVLVTRLRPYGSGDNIPANYYLNSEDYHVDGNESSELAISHLMLPASQWTKDGVKHPSNAYLEQNTDLYGVREGVVLWDGSDPELGEIKPSIYGLTIQDLLNLMASGDSYRPDEAKWHDTSQRIDKIITGAAPTDNGVKNEAGYDFTEVESSGSLAEHSFGTGGAYIDVEFNDLVMGTTPSVSHLAEFRIVPTSENKVAASFDVQASVASAIRTVTAYLTPYVGGIKISDATYPCTVTEETISNTVEGITYTKRYKISLLDSTGNPIVFSSMYTGNVTFRIVAHIDFNGNPTGFPVVRNEYAVSFNLLRGNKAIDEYFSVTIPQIGFDLSAAVANGAKLCMRSGANQPREFQIVPSSVRYLPDTDTWFVRCKRSVDQSISTYFPNSNAVIATGDEYYFTGITMPPLYVEIAAQKLLTAATAWLALHSKPRMLSAVDVDNKVMAVECIVLKEGMALPISDTDLDIQPGTQESRIIDNIRIEEGSDAIRTFSVTLRDKKEKSSLDAAIRGATSNLATNSSVNEALSAAVNTGHGSLTGRDMPNQHPISAITGLEDALLSSGFFELGDQAGLVQLKSTYDYLGPRKGLKFVAQTSEIASNPPDLYVRTVVDSLGNNVRVLYSPLPLITGGDQIVLDGTPGGGGTGGAGYLYELNDVYSNGLKQAVLRADNSAKQNGDVLTYNSTKDKWVAAPSAGLVTSVAGVSPVNGDIPTADLKSALSLGSLAYLDTVPIATSSIVGGVKSSTTGTTASRDYLVEVNSDGTMKVNVPWTDTTYTAGTGIDITNRVVSLTSAVQTSLGKADTAYQKPSGGIPDSDLATSYLPLSAGSSKPLTGALYMGSHTINGVGTLNIDNNRGIYWKEVVDSGTAGNRLMMYLSDSNNLAIGQGLRSTAKTTGGILYLYGTGIQLYTGSKTATGYTQALFIDSSQNASFGGNLYIPNSKIIYFDDKPSSGSAVSRDMFRLNENNQLIIGTDLKNCPSNGQLYLNGTGLYFRTANRGSSNSWKIRATIDSSGYITFGSSSALATSTYPFYVNSNAYMNGNLTLPSGKKITIGDAEIEWIPNDGNGYLKINKPLVTEGDQIVISGTPGGGGGGGVSYIYELLDFQESQSKATVNGTMLVFDSSATPNLGADGAWKYLAPDTSNTKKFLTMTSSNGNPALPTWGTISAYDVNGLGAAATYGVASSVSQNDTTHLVTGAAVWSAIDALPEPMIFKGSLGTGGTITSLPAASSANDGWTYKVITDGTYAGQAAKIGDLFISNGSSWIWIPSGDEPEGTVTSIGLTLPTGLVLDTVNGSASPITTSGTFKIAFDTGYSIPTTTKQGNWDTAYGWGDHAQAGYLLASVAATTYHPKGGDTQSNTFKIGGATFTFHPAVSGVSAAYLEIDCALLTQGDQVVSGGTPGGGGGGGAGYLYELGDVLTDADQTNVKESDGTTNAGVGDILTYNGSKWYALKLGTGISIDTSGSQNVLNATGTTYSDTGSATNPVYFSDGIPVACTYSLNKTVPSDAVFTDQNVKVNETNPSSGTWYFPVWYTATSGTGNVNANNSLRYYLTGIASTNGYAILSLGNQTPSGTAGSQCGYLRIYSTGTNHGTLAVGALTDNRTYTFPDATGTVVLNTATQALTNKTYNGLTLTKATTGFTIAGGTTSKTLTVSNTYTLGDACAKAVVTSIDTSASLPTSNAVKTFVEGKGYLTSVAFSDLTSHPTTIANYGITDAYISSSAVYLGSNSVGTSSDPIGYATQAKRPRNYAGTAEAGGYDLNTLLAGGGITSQYNSTTYWANGPSGMSFGGVVQFNPNATASQSLAMQLAWDIVNNSQETGKLWWRDRGYNTSTSTSWWGSWHLIYDDVSLTKSVITGLLDAGNGTYLKLAGGTMTGGLIITMTGNDHLTVNRTNSGVAWVRFQSDGTTVGYLGVGSNNEAYFHNTSAQYNLWHRGNSGTGYAWGCTTLTASSNVTIGGTLGVTGLTTATGGILLPNNVAISAKNSSNTTTEVLCYSSSDTLRIGYGHVASGTTDIYGKRINLRSSDSTAGPDIYIGGGTNNLPAGTIYFYESLSAIRNGLKIAAEHGASASRIDLNIYTSNNGSSPYEADWVSTVYIKCNGNVGIGTTSLASGAKLTVDGAISSTGDQVVTSDATLKTNWRDLNYGVEDIARCTAGVFDWKDGHGTSAGSKAQDWKSLVPELVHGEEGSMNLAYGQIAMLNTILLARHESEQDKEIRTLKARVEELENEVNRLRS